MGQGLGERLWFGQTMCFTKQIDGVNIYCSSDPMCVVISAVRPLSVYRYSGLPAQTSTPSVTTEPCEQSVSDCSLTVGGLLITQPAGVSSTPTTYYTSCFSLVVPPAFITFSLSSFLPPFLPSNVVWPSPPCISLSVPVFACFHRFSFPACRDNFHSTRCSTTLLPPSTHLSPSV